MRSSSRPRTTALVRSALLYMLAWAADSAAAPPETTLIKSVTVLSAEGEVISSYVGDVVLRGDAIIYAGKKAPWLPGRPTIIDGRGKFLMPGLIDSHVHVGFTIGVSEDDQQRKERMIANYFAQQPRSYLYYGVTTVIDLGDLRERAREQFEAAPAHPRLYGAGRSVRYFDGYGQSFIKKPERYQILPNWVYDQHQVKDLPQGTDLSLHTPRAAVDQAVKAGAVVIKTYYEDGFGGTFEIAVPTQELLNQIVAEAHARKLPAALHATSVGAYQHGLLAGVDIFAHGLWHWGKIDHLSIHPPAEADAVFRQVAAQGRYVQSTMRVVQGEADTYRWDVKRLPELEHALPTEWITWFASAEGRWPQRDLIKLYAERRPDAAIAPETYLDALVQRGRAAIKLAAEHQVKLILASDTPASEGFSTVPGLNTYLELRALAEAGVSLEQIFLAATLRNAMAFGLADKLGSIKAGKAADLLLLSADPLKDVSAYDQIDTVFVAGKRIPRKKLSAAQHPLR